MSTDAAASREQDALRAAQLYYLQDLTMDAIAHEMRVSRSSVSRMLAHARDVGLVTINVHSPQDARSLVERRLAERFGVIAHVVPTPERISEADRLERTALSAARILAHRLESSMTIGVAWGATLSVVGRHLQAKVTHDSHIVQMNGAANVRTSGIPYAGEILDRFGAALSASVHQFPVPALFDDPMTKDAMWRERSIRAVLDMQDRVSVFVFGLGSPHAEVPSHVYSGDYFDDIDLRAIERAGVVGDCATVFYRLDGSSDGIDLNARSSGPDLESVRRIPTRFCVVSSLSKLDALRGALAAGIITELVVEETLARRLLAVVGR
ncbi:DNA-binding transcriptional regulator LsrR (DeoR family) [Microbacterium sp. AG1240]|uniref:sugar-binding transcriptional regulator n=1 Tax=Microbacterium sp. AG1240 TaxID=2183992 RepID=UPI000EB535F1|nr:sugar-binding domain-containing protein [Microbacterium sp. AG1240]RKT33735.1 DNA-binding transcriptional regulator LsrR (DeoR family) [Microbacterium sp. AG1240]